MKKEKKLANITKEVGRKSVEYNFKKASTLCLILQKDHFITKCLVTSATTGSITLVISVLEA